MPVLLFDLSWPLPSGRKMVYQFYIYTCIYACKIICMYNVYIYYACICIVVLFTIRNSSRIMVLATYKHLSSEQYIDYSQQNKCLHNNPIIDSENTKKL